jgi:hypothetical protein
MARSSEAIYSSYVAPNPNRHLPNHLPTAMHSQVHHKRHPSTHRSVRESKSTLAKTVPLKRMYDVWRWKPTRFYALHTTRATHCILTTLLPLAPRETPKIERRIDINTMKDDQPGSAANQGVELLPNEQNVARTTLFKDQIRLCL